MTSQDGASKGDLPLERLEKLAQWLDSSANMQGAHDAPPEPATQFDYELCLAAGEVRLIAAALAATPAVPAVGGGLTDDTQALIDELEAASERFTRYTNNPVDGLLQAAADTIRALSAQAPAEAEAPQEVPVAWWRWSYVDQQGNADADVQIGANKPTTNVLPDNGFPWQPLYGAPLATPSQPPNAVQAGWKLVPIEPTEEMLDAGCDIEARAEAEAENLKRFPDLMPWASAGQVLEIEYREMLAAAPSHPAATPSQPSNAVQEVSIEAIRRLFVEHGHIYAGWLELGRAILALRSGASAQATPAAAVPDGWQPIATSPKSGLVDILNNGRRYADCHYDQICSEFRHITACGVLIRLTQATHWMQPPAALAAAQPLGEGKQP